MRHIKLIARTDYSTGELGLMLEPVKIIDTPMVATEGLLIAHDILEHQNGLKSIGSVDDELEALGGAWFIRGQFNDLSRDGRGSAYTPHENIASDVLNLGMIFVAGNVNFRTPVPKTRKTDMDDDFEEICELGFRGLKAELEDDINWVRFFEYKAAVIHYLRRGFNKAKKRFGSATKANSLFWIIAEAVEPIIKWVEFEGQEFRLSYDSNRAYCEEIYPEEY